MTGLRALRKLSALVAPVFVVSAVGVSAAGCASDKCGTIALHASVSGTKTYFGSCGGGNLGVPVTGDPDQLANLEATPFVIHVGDKATFTYSEPGDSGYTHGAAVSDPAVVRLDKAPASGSTLAVVVGVAPGTALLTIDPTWFCAGASKTIRCVVTAIEVVPK